MRSLFSKDSPIKNRAAILFVLLAVAMVVLFAADLLLGSVSVGVSDVWGALTGGESGDTSRYIVMRFRLPKALTALLAGMALPTAGLLMQTLFRNPLAGPYVLGVSSGASLGVSVLLMGVPLLGAGTGFVADLGVAGAAWLGAAAIMVVVLAVSARIKDIMAVLILGMMFGSAATALVEILQYMSPEGAVKQFVVWTMGSLGSVTDSRLLIMTLVVLVGLVLSVGLLKPLNLLQLGENYARTMGVDVRRIRVVITVVTVFLAGTTTAFCGPIGFIGLAVPHIARMLFRQADHRVLLPATMLTGGAVLLFCDVVAQMPWSDMTLPINTVTALIGIPVIVAVVVRSRKG